jgi:hypothetical protein
MRRYLSILDVHVIKAVSKCGRATLHGYEKVVQQTALHIAPQRFAPDSVASSGEGSLLKTTKKWHHFTSHIEVSNRG